MPDLDGTDNEERLTYRDRVQHMRFTLADICVRATWENISFWRFLNRTLFLFQAPLCFAVFRRASEEGYLLDRNTMRDPLYRLPFKHALSRIGVDIDAPGCSIPQGRLQPYVIQIFTTDFYVVAFAVNLCGGDPCRLHEVAYNAVPSDSDIGKALQSIFRPFGSCLVRLGIEDHLHQSFTRLFSLKDYSQATHDDPRKYPTPDTELYAVRNYYDNLCLLIDEEIDRILFSPVLCATGLSRFLLFIKVFDRQDVRFSHYFYDIKLRITQKQKDQLKKHLTPAMVDGVEPFCDKAVTAWFRQRIASGTDRDFNEIFDILDAPLGRHSRLFCEYPLLSGAAILDINPFSRGDIGWYAKAVHGRSNDFAHEMKRFAILHYILLAMARAAGFDRPALLTLPIRVDGATWMSATTVVSAAEDEQYHGLVDSDEFERRFLFYHSLMREFETRLRRKTKQRYLWAVCNVLSAQVKSASKRTDNNGETPPIDLNAKDIAQLATKSVGLCRLYPFKPILFGPVGSARRYGWTGGEIGSGYKLDCGIAGKNPYFDRAPLSEFLRLNEVKARIREYMDSEMGLREIRKRQTPLSLVRTS